jgi:uncharacterized protein (DUF2147 family)
LTCVFFFLFFSFFISFRLVAVADLWLNPRAETELGQAREAANAAKAAQITAAGELASARAEAKNLTEDVRKLRENMSQLQQDFDAERGENYCHTHRTAPHCTAPHRMRNDDRHDTQCLLSASTTVTAAPPFHRHHNTHSVTFIARVRVSALDSQMGFASLSFSGFLLSQKFLKRHELQR